MAVAALRAAIKDKGEYSPMADEAVIMTMGEIIDQGRFRYSSPVGETPHADNIPERAREALSRIRSIRLRLCGADQSGPLVDVIAHFHSNCTLYPCKGELELAEPSEHTWVEFPQITVHTQNRPL